MKRFKIVTVCGCGLGSSLMAKMSIEEILRNSGYSASVETADGGTAAGYNCDFYVTTKQFADRLKDVKQPVVIVSNLVNKAELKEKMMVVVEALSEK